MATTPGAGGSRSGRAGGGTPTKPPVDTQKPTSTSSGSRSGGGTGGGGGSPSGGGSPTLSQQELAEQYGWALSFLKSDSSLWKVFQDAVKGNWTPSKFQAAVRDTSWWKKNSGAAREWSALWHTDRAEANARISRTTESILDTAARLGARISTGTAKKIATDSLRLGWNDGQIRNALAKFVTAINGKWAGEAAKNMETIKNVSMRNGYSASNSQLTNWVQQIAAGSNSMETVEDYVRNVAAGTFKAYEKEILAGQDVIDLAAPYIDSMGRILEQNPGKLNLNDVTIRKAMQFKNNDGLPETLGVQDFEEQLRNDPRWRKTKNSQDSLNSVAHNLLQRFGLIA